MKTKHASESGQLLLDIRQAAGSLSDAWRAFDQTCDPDQIEACIYTINAQVARYTQLLKQARQTGLRCSYFAAEENEAAL